MPANSTTQTSRDSGADKTVSEALKKSAQSGSELQKQQQTSASERAGTDLRQSTAENTERSITARRSEDSTLGERSAEKKATSAREEEGDDITITQRPEGKRTTVQRGGGQSAVTREDLGFNLTIELTITAGAVG